ncbi:MAG TPA: alpha-hydroxy acid oxidase [Chloroflexota bacterium]|nr:alpha-hydroxy acid oxidase [Chloroflexota bacterium]
MDRPEDWITIPEIVQAAKERLPINAWDYSFGGAETETTLRRNRTAFDYVALRPRVLRDVRSRTTSTTFLGNPLSLPVMLAPIGGPQNYDPDGALACARAADQVGTMAFIGTLSSPSMEEVRAGSNGPLVFQIYIRGDRAWLAALVRRVETAGYSALCLTVDSAAYGRRERDLHKRYFRGDGGTQPNLAGLPGSEGGGSRDYQAGLTWDDVDWLRSATPLPIILKGILSPEDAELAVQHGVQVVYVSNHGGRQLDHAPATLDVLPEIVRAVDGRAEVLVDSGFMRGTDVVKALALGARAVLIGKLMAWALGAGGTAGVARALEILRTEMLLAMANIGVTSIAEIGPACVRASYPPREAPWPVNIDPPRQPWLP